MTNYQSKVTVQERSPYLDYLIEPSIQRVNRNFVSSFENTNDRISYRRHCLPQVETKNYNVMIDGWNFFDQPINNNLRTYDNIQKIAACQGGNYTTGCLLDYPYFTSY